MGPNKDSEEATKPPQSPLSREKLNFCEENVGSSDFLLCKANKLLLFSVMWNTAGLLSVAALPAVVILGDMLPPGAEVAPDSIQKYSQPYLEKYIPGENLLTYG